MQRRREAVLGEEVDEQRAGGERPLAGRSGGAEVTPGGGAISGALMAAASGDNERGGRREPDPLARAWSPRGADR